MAISQRIKTIQRVGVIGGGQLAWMMAGAAEKLGIELVVQTPSATDPAATVVADKVFAKIDDAGATAQLAKQCEVITFENEFIDLEALKTLEQQGILFRPQLSCLAPLLDKYDQRNYLKNLGLPVPEFTRLEAALTSNSVPLAFPLVLKARRHGYDGQGTFIVKDEASLTSLLQKVGNLPLLVEEFIPFERELAVIAARSETGEIVIYPVVETQQKNQVCRWVIAPAEIPPEITQQVENIAQTLLNHLAVVGLFGIELFLTAEGRVLVNEIAPRTHNSGHFTLDACNTSQFEQQLRAVCQLPLGTTELNCPGAVMVNLLGYEQAQSDYLEKRQKLAQIPNTKVHWYGKTESRPGRKLGHVTVKLETEGRGQALAIAQTIESIWYPGPLD